MSPCEAALAEIRSTTCKNMEKRLWLEAKGAVRGLGEIPQREIFPSRRCIIIIIIIIIIRIIVWLSRCHCRGGDWDEPQLPHKCPIWLPHLAASPKPLTTKSQALDLLMVEMHGTNGEKG